MSTFSSLSQTTKRGTMTFRLAAFLVLWVLSTLPTIANATALANTGSDAHISHAELFGGAEVRQLSTDEMSETHGETSMLELIAILGIATLIALGVISLGSDLIDSVGQVTEAQTEAMNQYGNQQNNTQNNTQTNTNNVAAGGNFNGAGTINNGWNSVPTVNVTNGFSTVTVVGVATHGPCCDTSGFGGNGGGSDELPETGENEDEE